MITEDDLGPLTRIYQTNDRERRKRALIPLVVGAVSTAPAIAWAIVVNQQLDQSNATSGWALGIVVGFPVMMLVMGAILVVGFWLSRDEKFHLYENCLVRETREEVNVVWWRDVYKVAPMWGNGSVVQWGLGGNEGCRLRLTSGQTMYITGFTEDATELRRHVEDRSGN